jgi:hypothetical protein
MAEVYRQKPWARGLVETLTAVKLLRHSSIETKNRQALILLDSALEIGFKNFLIYEKEIKLEKDNPVLQYRDKLHKVVAEKTEGLFGEGDWSDQKVWKLIGFYYEARCDLYHEIAEKTLSDSSINDFYDLVAFVLDKLFAIYCKDLVPAPLQVLPIEDRPLVNLKKLRKPIELIIVAVAHSKSRRPRDVKVALGKLGSKRRLTASQIATYLNNYSDLFDRDVGTGLIELSDQGLIRYRDLAEVIQSS